MIGVVDYGSGNIQAVINIYNRLRIPSRVVNVHEDLTEVTKIVLPGVGAFDEAMSRLNMSGLREALDDAVLVKKVPVMGICVGMQVMGNSSDEGNLEGLGWIPGHVEKFDTSKMTLLPKLPHMGWNNVNLKSVPIFKNINEDFGFYFLHSYYFNAKSKINVIGSSVYQDEFDCAINENHIYGFQFHPEKSHSNGIQLFKNFWQL